MALTPQIRVTQAEALVTEKASPDVRVTQSSVRAATYASGPSRVTGASMLAAINFPTPQERTTQLQALVTVRSAPDVRTTEAVVLAAVRGRVANPKLRAWTFTLDGHDFYVLRLGTELTLVYDVYSEQWVDWDAFEQTYWPVLAGMNWVGGTGLLDSEGHNYGSNVVVGDDTLGLLWILEPEQAWDEALESADPQQEVFFERVTQGQVPMTGRQVLPCYAAWLTTDMGDPAYVGAGVTLEISDDAGKTYFDAGTVTVTTGVNTPEIAWYSLGQIAAPGRLFKITDDGAVARIDSMEMNDPDDK